MQVEVIMKIREDENAEWDSWESLSITNTPKEEYFSELFNTFMELCRRHGFSLEDIEKTFEDGEQLHSILSDYDDGKPL